VLVLLLLVVVPPVGAEGPLLPPASLLLPQRLRLRPEVSLLLLLIAIYQSTYEVQSVSD